MEHISLTPFVSAAFWLLPCFLGFLHWIAPDLLEVWMSDRRVMATAGVAVTFGGIALMIG